MRFRTWKNVAKEGVVNIFKNRVMSLASICAITAALFVLGIVLIAVLNLNNIVEGIGSKIEITVYVQDRAGYMEITDMEKQIESWDGVTDLEFVSRDQALDRWRQEWGDQEYLLDGYGPDNNPLPNSFNLVLESPEVVEDVAGKAETMEYVERVQYSRGVVDSITKISNVTRLVGMLIVLILVIMSMIIINNTIRIAVYSRRREINIMKYIGATDWYVRWPFIFEGLTLGLIGAAVAAVLTGGLYWMAVDKSADLIMQDGLLSMFSLLPLEDMVFPILTAFVLVGGLVGSSASLLSTRKHLRV